MNKDYFLLFITMVGTTITPYMQFYLQSAVVDKGVRIDEYRYAKFDVYAGSFMTVFIAFFIVLSTGTILHPAGVVVDSAENAAQALQPLAGDFASHLFAIGLLNASFLAAFVLPLATAYGLSEAFGWESGINKSFREAPQFLGFYTAFIVIGAGVSCFRTHRSSRSCSCRRPSMASCFPSCWSSCCDSSTMRRSWASSSNRGA